MPGPSAPQPKQKRTAEQQRQQPRTFDNQAFNPARQVSREAFWMKHGIDKTGDYY